MMQQLQNAEISHSSSLKRLRTWKDNVTKSNHKFIAPHIVAIICTCARRENLHDASCCSGAAAIGKPFVMGCVPSAPGAFNM